MTEDWDPACYGIEVDGDFAPIVPGELPCFSARRLGSISQDR